MNRRLVDVGGYRLEVIEQGGGSSPPVVFAHGLTGSTEEWVSGVLPLLADDNFQQIAFARPGVGASDRLPPEIGGAPVPLSWAAGQMRRLLDAMGVSSPRVLAGHSIAATIAMVYARLWPEEVAGLVLVDPSNTRFWLDHPWVSPVEGDAEEGSIRFDFIASGHEWPTLPPPRQGVPSVILTSAIGRYLDLPEDHLAQYLPSTAQELDDEWQTRQRQYADEFDAVHVISQTASHVVHIEQPELTAFAVRSIIDAVRTGTRPNLDSAEVHALGADLVRS